MKTGINIYLSFAALLALVAHDVRAQESVRRFNCHRITKGRVIESNGNLGEIETLNSTVTRTERVEVLRPLIGSSTKRILTEEIQENKYGTMTLRSSKELNWIEQTPTGFIEHSTIRTENSGPNLMVPSIALDNRFEVKQEFIGSDDGIYRPSRIVVNGNAVNRRWNVKVISSNGSVKLETTLMEPFDTYWKNGGGYRVVEDVEICMGVSARPD